MGHTAIRDPSVDGSFLYGLIAQKGWLEMLMEIYYEHYRENCNRRYWEMDKKSIPYMVLIRDFDTREKFKSFLNSNGFRCVGWNPDYPGVLVNLELKRFVLIYRACKHSCVGDRNYTLDEFMDEVWSNRQQPKKQNWQAE